MNRLDELFTQEPWLWRQAIPPEQRRSVEELLERGVAPAELAGVWLTAPDWGEVERGAIKKPQSRTASSASMGEAFMDQIEAFLCGDPRYATERRKLQGALSVTHTTVVSAISAALAPTFGAPVAVLIVPVALLLSTLGRCTVASWCQTRRARLPADQTVPTRRRAPASSGGTTGQQPRQKQRAASGDQSSSNSQDPTKTKDAQ